MSKQLINGREYVLARPVFAYPAIGRDWNLKGTAVRTTTDNAGNQARVTGIFQYGHTRRGNINKKRALVRLSDVRHPTLWAWIDADQAVEIKHKKNPTRAQARPRPRYSSRELKRARRRIRRVFGKGMPTQRVRRYVRAAARNERTRANPTRAQARGLVRAQRRAFRNPRHRLFGVDAKRRGGVWSPMQRNLKSKAEAISAARYYVKIGRGKTIARVIRY